ncbi:MAG: Bax inhibitor-1/YccA family protein, partial [Isosphaeraceae bacterium]
MATFETSNPAFTNSEIARYASGYGYGASVARPGVMTVQGTIGKTSLLLAILTATAFWSWNAAASQQIQPGVFIAALVGTLVLALVTVFKPTLAMWTAPVYAAFEGVLLGGTSFIVERMARGGYPGMAFQAVMLTAGVLCVMLFAYGSRLIRVTDKLRMGIVAATGGLCLFYLISMVLSMFGMQMGFLRAPTPLGIGISLLAVGLASFNLLLDFDFIERASRSGAPKSMEWYGAFGLMVTLVWLYIEILRLLSLL